MRARNVEFGMRNDVKLKRNGVFALVVVLGVMSVSAAERTWTRSEILAAADAKAKELGYDVERMSVSFDVYNSGWRDYLKSIGRTDAAIDSRLDGRTYFAVYYAPLKTRKAGVELADPALGGDLWIFIDGDSGEVIYSLSGQ